LLLFTLLFFIDEEEAVVVVDVLWRPSDSSTVIIRGLLSLFIVIVDTWVER
jgi:hypothetical protein